MALVRLEMRERAGGRVDLLAARADPSSALDHVEPGVLLDLMVAELLAGVDSDEDGAGLVLALQDDRRSSPVRSRDFGEPPALHRGAV